MTFPTISSRWRLSLAAGCLLAFSLAPSPARAQVSTTITLKTLHTFHAASDGAYPYGGLIKGDDDNFYGTTSAGGAGGKDGGTLFNVAPDGTLTTFVSYDIAQPYSTLVEGPDKALYGTADEGGKGNSGFIFRLPPGGTPSIFAILNSSQTGSAPRTGLAVGADGLLYGTTLNGGAYDQGTVYSVDFQGVVRTLHSFNAAYGEGTVSYGVLVQGRDGKFYGTTAADGAHGQGTVFNVNTLGGFTTVYAFTGGADGGGPRAGLLLGSNGNFYGTTNSGGAGGSGTVFQLTPQGDLTVLHAFSGGSDGAHPGATLVDGGDGSFYGTTLSGGAANDGTIFSVTPAGNYKLIYSFTGGSDGSSPTGPLALGGDGIFYGTTSMGGDNKGQGTVFRLNLHTAPPAPGTLAFVTTAFAVNENVGSLTLTVARTGGTTGAVSVRYSTTDGTAMQGVDYQANGGQLVWRDGDAAPKSFKISIIDQGLYDGSTRTFSARLLNPVGATLGEAATVGVSILENDPPPPPFVPTVTLTVLGDGTATVGGSPGKILFSRDGDLTKPLTVNYVVKGKARNGTDYDMLSGQVTIPARKANYKLKIKPRRTAQLHGNATIKLLPDTPRDGSFQVTPLQVKIKFVNPG